MSTECFADRQRPGAEAATEQLQLRLHTRTPLYTGGIAQSGEQLQPAGLLGSIQRFSTLVARTLGDDEFEQRVWGNPGSANAIPQAKQVALGLDPAQLEPVNLPNRIQCERNEHTGKPRTWYFGQALQGPLGLTLTRNGITEADWNLLKIALRIQIRHATFGAKDQFGLGVLGAETLPPCQPLGPEALLQEPSKQQPGLHNAALLHCTSEYACPETRHDRLQAGLCWRAKLRDALRHLREDHHVPEGGAVLTDAMRHYLMGYLGGKGGGTTFGSAINISALYPEGGGCALRVWGVFPHTTTEGDPPHPPGHPELTLDPRTLKSVLSTLIKVFNAPPELNTMPRLLQPSVTLNGRGSRARQDLPGWLNQLAGIEGTS